MPCSTQKPFFMSLTSILRYQLFYELLKRTATLSTFLLSMMFGMHFDNVSGLLNSVAAAYAHLATPSVTITC